MKSLIEFESSKARISHSSFANDIFINLMESQSFLWLCYCEFDCRDPIGENIIMENARFLLENVGRIENSFD